MCAKSWRLSESKAKWSQLRIWFEFYNSWKAEVTPQPRYLTLACLNLPIPSVMTDNSGKQSAALRPCPQTNHLNPEWALLHADMKGSGNVLLEANNINTLLSLNCLSLRAQPFSTLVQSCHFTACVWGRWEKKFTHTLTYTQQGTNKKPMKCLLPATIKLMNLLRQKEVKWHNCAVQVSKLNSLLCLFKAL